MSHLISECLKLAQDNSADQLFFQSNSSVKMKAGKEIREIKNARGNAINIRQLVSEFLEEEEKKKLFEEMKIAGHKKIGQISFSFDFQIDFSGISGAIEFHKATSTQWTFSPIVLELVAKRHGLNLVVGPRRSGKSTAIQSILDQLQNKQKVIAVYSERDSQDFQSNGNIIFNYPISQLVNHGIHSNAEVIVIDVQRPEYCEQALSLAEEGLQVVLSLPFWSLEMGLQRFIDLLGGDAKVASRRLAMVLQFAIGVKLVPGEDGNSGIFELLVNDKSTQSILELQNFRELAQVMKSGSERAGMRTLNQSLFQLMLKRKIDFRSAFEASNNPEELDALLKKVGI